jgi:hypothetical protein
MKRKNGKGKILISLQNMWSYCRDHNKKRQNQYCLDCEKALCDKCKDLHKSHTVLKMSEIEENINLSFRQFEKKIKAKLSQINEEETENLKLEEEMTTELKSMKTIAEEITGKFCDLMQRGDEYFTREEENLNFDFSENKCLIFSEKERISYCEKIKSTLKKEIQDLVKEKNLKTILEKREEMENVLSNIEECSPLEEKLRNHRESLMEQKRKNKELEEEVSANFKELEHSLNRIFRYKV